MDTVKVYSRTVFEQDPKWDSSFKLLFLLKGELSVFVGSRERHLYEHDITFISPFELHGGISTSNSCKALVINVSPELWSILCPDLDKMDFSISVLRPNDRMSAYTSICSSISQIIYYSQFKGGSSNARICSAVGDIIATLTDNYSTGQTGQKLKDQNFSRIYDILRYIVDNYNHHFSLEDISKEIGFHPQYFSAYFKKQFGVSFIDYLNNYRIGRSIELLRDTDDSLLNIALACGFNNQKTYSNAFKKRHECSPSEYRKKLREYPLPDSIELQENELDYLLRFWNVKFSNEPYIQKTSTDYSIILKEGEPCSVNKIHNFISIGRALSCLRSDMQRQLLKAKQDLDLEYVRIRDIFSDDLFVYYEDRNKTPVFSWRAVDEILDFLVESDLKPFIEIGYMPGQMASRKQYAGWHYHPNVSAPKSIKLWENLVANFISHLLSRYGRETVESWLFDFWTSPNLHIRQGYWNESIEEFFHFYLVTYNAIRKADPCLKFGSPNFTFPSGMSYYEMFFSFMQQNNIKPDFISIHLYSCGDGEEINTQDFMEYSVFDNNYDIPNIKPYRFYIPEAVEELHRIMNTKGISDLPVIIDDWNVTFFPTDFTRDTCFMGPYVTENYFNLCSEVYGMGFASLSDIHEDFFNTDQMFNGGPGLLTYSGIPKSSYYALSMASHFSRHILQKGSSHILGKTENGYELIIYNLNFYNKEYVGNDPSVISFTSRYNVFEDIPDLECHVEIPAESGIYNIVRTMIGKDCGSSYDTWVKMGSPSDITPDIAEYLKNSSAPAMSCMTVQCAGTILLNETVEPHSVVHFLITKEI